MVHISYIHKVDAFVRDILTLDYVTMTTGNSCNSYCLMKIITTRIIMNNDGDNNNSNNNNKKITIITTLLLLMLTTGITIEVIKQQQH